MYWDQNEYEPTTPLYQSTNFVNIDLAPGYSKFKVYCQKDKLVRYKDSDPMVNMQQQMPAMMIVKLMGRLIMKVPSRNHIPKPNSD